MRVVSIVVQMNLRELGRIALDGSKVHANASPHDVLSYQRASEIEAQLEGEVGGHLAPAEHVDTSEAKQPLDRPAELARRETRRSAIAEAKVEIERRASERAAAGR